MILIAPAACSPRSPICKARGTVSACQSVITRPDLTARTWVTVPAAVAAAVVKAAVFDTSLGVAAVGDDHVTAVAASPAHALVPLTLYSI